MNNHHHDRDDAREATRHAHNNASLNQLLAHIETQCSEQCRSLDEQAAAEALEIVQRARDRAAELLRRARERERGEAHERLRAERARQRMRLRRAWLERRRALAERGMQRVADALAALWNESAAVRSCWLQRALDEAVRVLPPGEWRLECPSGWDPDEGRDLIDAFVEGQAGIAVDPGPGDDIAAGFRMRLGASRIDLTTNGLLARSDRVAGYLLAGLAAEPPELPHD